MNIYHIIKLSGGGDNAGTVHFYNEPVTQEHKYAEDHRETKEQSSQTETIFGLRDLPTVAEIVNSKIQEKQAKEEPDLSGRQNVW